MPVLWRLALGTRRSPNEEEQDKLHFAAGTGRVAVKPGAIPGRQVSLQVMATVFQAALQVVQADTARFARFRSSSFSSFPSSPQPRRSNHQRSVNSHCQVPQRKTQQLCRPRFFICQAIAALPTNQLFDASGPLSNDGAV